MLDRKMAIYTIQVCGWTGNMGETNQRHDQRPQNKKQITGSIQHGHFFWSAHRCPHVASCERLSQAIHQEKQKKL